MKNKSNIDASISGGSVQAPQSAFAKAAIVDLLQTCERDPSALRTKKIFELPEDLVADLEQFCVDARRKIGRRVTQLEVVEIALRKTLDEYYAQQQ